MADWWRDDGGCECNSDGGTSAASHDVAHTGRYATKLTIDGSATNNANGGQGVHLFRWRDTRQHSEGLYYSAYLSFPQQYAINGWWNIWQWKSSDGSRNDRTWGLQVRNRADGQMYIVLKHWQTSKTFTQAVANLPVGRWVHIEACFLDTSDAAGRVTFWQDGMLLWNIQGVQTTYPNSKNAWSVNNYGGDIYEPDGGSNIVNQWC